MTTTPDLSLPAFSSLPTLPTTELVLLAFYVILAVYVVFSGVLYFHWSTYAENKRVISLTYLAYVVLTIPLLTCMGIISLLIL